ncbi:MAG: hypothetical protein QOH85_850 [Acidobacteriaceae bacterium]|jgi:hypothetical protein|nr:hypothetical protein [Acidobacteriaceae bacterium]
MSDLLHSVIGLVFSPSRRNLPSPGVQIASFALFVFRGSSACSYSNRGNEAESSVPQAPPDVLTGREFPTLARDWTTCVQVLRHCARHRYCPVLSRALPPLLQRLIRMAVQALRSPISISETRI